LRRRNSRSAQIGGPAGISICFQVSTYSGEPFSPILARNLFSKDSCRAALGDEAVKSGPEVSFVDMTLSLSRDRKRLTWTWPGPYGLVVIPSGETEGGAPAANAGEEMGLCVASEVVGWHVNDWALVNVSGSDVSSSDEVAQPLCGIGINFVVIGAAHGTPRIFSARWSWVIVA
jgi:hypothetical protein